MGRQVSGEQVYVLPEGAQRVLGRDAMRVNIAIGYAVANIVKTTLGPKGMDKMLVSDLGDIVITNDGATTKFYINGILNDEDTQEFEKDTNHTETFIGKGFECSSIYGSFRCADSFFNGNLDDLRIYNEVLTEEQIKSIYQETKKL